MTVPSRMGRTLGGAVPLVTVNWEYWVLTLTAGDTSWDDTDKDSSKLPYCAVGKWDNGNFWDWLDSLASLGVDQYSSVSQVLLQYTSLTLSVWRDRYANLEAESTNGLSLGVLIFYGTITFWFLDAYSYKHIYSHFNLNSRTS